MLTLSKLVKIHLEEEVKIIRDAGGRLWPKWVGLTILCAFLWVVGLFFGEPWEERDFGLAFIFVLVGPFVEQAWARYQVAAQMRHEQEVRIELKLDVLLGLVHVEDVEMDR